MPNVLATAQQLGGESLVIVSGQHATTPRAEAPRLEALDGLRGLAILLVVLHNSGTVNGALSSIALKIGAFLVAPGWVGVQLFFALSGFLITRLLLQSKQAKGYFRRFYMRRVLRIFPLYYLALVVVLVIAPNVPGLEALGESGPRSSLWYWTYLVNWVQPFGGLVNSLGHFWSLAVEEQFYLVWPVLVLVLGARWLARLCAALVVGSLLVRIAVFQVLPAGAAAQAAYQLTISRCDALALGALVAMAIRDPFVIASVRRWVSRLWIVVAVALVALVVVQHGLNPLEFPVVTFGQTLVALLATALVLWCADPQPAGVPSFVARTMRAGWLRRIGRYSYSIYIVHVPITVLTRPYVVRALSFGTASSRVAAHVAYVGGVFLLSYGIAMVTWYAIEQPFLNLKRFFPMPTVRVARLV